MHRGFVLYPAEELAKSAALTAGIKPLAITGVIIATLLCDYMVLSANYPEYRPFLLRPHDWMVSILSLLYVGFLGGVGATLSFQRRLFSVSNPGRLLISIIEDSRNMRQFFFIPATGAMFAFVAFLLFASGLASGALFPDAKSLLSVHGLNVFFTEGGGLSPNFAKVSIWSIVSGFGEQWIPDVLDKLNRDQAKGAKK